MSIEDTKNMINALDTGDNVEAEKAFKASLSDKVGVELDTKRKDLAGTLLNKELEADKESNVDVEPTEIDD
jgi:hypothetical protein|tara:strand:- start:592 stop:804 length:213 start_codon:yes stop_codon:yes gene_type:complete